MSEPEQRELLHIIDIAMPFYGDPALFRCAVESVLGQTSNDWRLIVIDDAYPDTSPGEWLASLAHPKVTYIRNDTNAGVAATFNRSIQESNADWLVIMGCDDYLEPDYVEVMAQLIRRFPDVAYIQPGVRVIDDGGSVTRPLPDRVKALYAPRRADAHTMEGEALAKSLLRGNWTYFPSICWRRDVIAAHGFQPEMDVAMDLALQMDIVCAGGSMAVAPDRIFRYRRHTASVSSWTAARGNRFVEEAAFFALCAARLEGIGWRDAARVSRRHLSSRLNALTNLPRALLNRDREGSSVLLGHLFGSRKLRQVKI